MAGEIIGERSHQDRRYDTRVGAYRPQTAAGGLRDNCAGLAYMQRLGQAAAQRNVAAGPPAPVSGGSSVCGF